MQKSVPTYTPLVDMLRLLFKRKWRVISIFLVTMFLVALRTLTMQPVYEASGQILVKLGRQNLYIPPSSTSGQVLDFNREDQINSEIQLLHNRALIEKVIQEIGAENIYSGLDGWLPKLIRKVQRSKASTLEEKALLLFYKDFSVEPVRESDVIELFFQHEDPKIAAEVINTLTTAYLDEHIRVHTSSESHKFFQEQSDLLKEKLEKSERKLETFKKENEVTSIEDQQKLLLDRISELRYGYNSTSSELFQTEKRLNQLQNQLDVIDQSIPQSFETGHNGPLIANLEARLIELQLQKQELLNKYTAKNRLVTQVEAEIGIVQEKLEEYKDPQLERNTTGVNPTYQRFQEAILQGESDVKALKAKQDIQAKQLQEYEQRLTRLNKLEVEHNQLVQSASVDRRNYLLYLDKYEEARILESMDQSKMNNVVFMKPALPPLKPISPRILFSLALGGLLGLFGGISAAFIADYFDDSLDSPEDVERTMDSDVLACIADKGKYSRGVGYSTSISQVVIKLPS